MSVIVQKSNESEIRQLIDKADGNWFSLTGPNQKKIPGKSYQGKREEFSRRIIDQLNLKTYPDGFYKVINGTNNQNATELFLIQKGTSETIQSLPEMDRSTDIALIKENAELKSELAYLKLRMDELTAQLEEQEADLAEGEEKKEAEKPNPWMTLAEQLMPLAGQVAAAIATKYLTPQTNGQEPTYIRPNVSANPGTNAAIVTQTVQYRKPNYSAVSESFDSSGTDMGNYNFESNQEE